MPREGTGFFVPGTKFQQIDQRFCLWRRGRVALELKIHMFGVGFSPQFIEAERKKMQHWPAGRMLRFGAFQKLDCFGVMTQQVMGDPCEQKRRLAVGLFVELGAGQSQHFRW